MRMLTDVEFETVRPLLISGTAAFNIIHFTYQFCEKRLNLQDVSNMRQKVFSQANVPRRQYAYLNC